MNGKQESRLQDERLSYRVALVRRGPIQIIGCFFVVLLLCVRDSGRTMESEAEVGIEPMAQEMQAPVPNHSGLAPRPHSFCFRRKPEAEMECC